MLKIKTTRFGELEIDEGHIIYMPEGLLGFCHCKSFIILEHDVDSPFKWYQSIDDPSLAFIIVDPYLFKPDYRIQISSQEIAPLQALEVEALVPVAIVSIHPELPRPITVNLQGPILINPDNRWARQCVLLRGGYQTRHDLLGEMERALLGPEGHDGLEEQGKTLKNQRQLVVSANPCGGGEG